MLLSIIFSFRNEREVIPELIERVERTLNSSKLKYELIFVNDASTDDSLELLKKYHERSNNVKIINMSRRFGGSQCVMAGFRYAKGDAVIYMDADLQDPPEFIPTMLQKYREGYDIVHTTRFARKGENIIKIWLTKLAYRMIHFLADIDIPNDSGDFKLLSRRVVNEIVKFSEHDPFMRGLVSWVGFKQIQVFYERQPRFAGKTHYPLLRNIGPLKEFIKGLTSFSSKPLYLPLFFCCFLFFIFLVCLVLCIIGIKLPWPFFVLTLVLLGSTILFIIGIQGIYIEKIYDEIRNRPLYIIESKIGFENDRTTKDT